MSATDEDLTCRDKACAATTADACKYPGTAAPKRPGLCTQPALRAAEEAAAAKTEPMAGVCRTCGHDLVHVPAHDDKPSETYHPAVSYDSVQTPCSALIPIGCGCEHPDGKRCLSLRVPDREFIPMADRVCTTCGHYASLHVGQTGPCEVCSQGRRNRSHIADHGDHDACMRFVTRKPSGPEAAVERCPRCRHAPHEGQPFCPNWASDNDCDCTYGQAVDPPVNAPDLPPGSTHMGNPHDLHPPRVPNVGLCTRKCTPERPDRECVVHGHLWEPPGPYIVSELGLSGLTVEDIDRAEAAGQPHPEATPVGPFRLVRTPTAGLPGTSRRGEADRGRCNLSTRRGCP